MQNLNLTILILIIMSSCKPNEKKDYHQEVESIEIQDALSPVLNIERAKPQKNMQNRLPIHGRMTEEKLDKYYPKMTDTIKKLRIFGSERLDLNPSNDIIVSLLHNTGTFDEMILCTHNSNFKLIDHLYIGKSTAFDNGKSHTVEYAIMNHNTIIFDLIDWGYVKDEIEPIKTEKLEVSINETGTIKWKKAA